MADFTAADVKKLRELTGAGMMDCKKALEEAGGDVDQAVEILRIKGAKDVGKRQERVAAQGLVAVDGGAMVELNCETDFVAKNADFQKLAADVVAHVKATRPADLDALLASTLADGRTVAETIEQASAVIGEKLQLRRFAVLEEPVATYLHRKDPALPPQVGVLVSFSGDDAEAARGAAMQIAAMRPRYLTRDEVPADVIGNERRIAEQTAREEGKPEQAISKIVDGKVNAFYKDFVLTEQASVLDQKKTVAQVLADAGVDVAAFSRFEVGQA